MARHSSHILEMARKGAEHRYHELKAEIAHLFKMFPHLAKGQRGKRSAAAMWEHIDTTLREASGPPVRTRRTMSAAARAKISAAQKARWAKQKAGEKKK